MEASNKENSEATSKYSEQFDKLKEDFGPFLDRAGEHAKIMSRRMDRYVHRNPWLAVAAGVIIGMTVVSWLRRR